MPKSRDNRNDDDVPDAAPSSSPGVVQFASTPDTVNSGAAAARTDKMDTDDEGEEEEEYSASRSSKKNKRKSSKVATMQASSLSQLHHSHDHNTRPSKKPKHRYDDNDDDEEDNEDNDNEHDADDRKLPAREKGKTGSRASAAAKRDAPTRAEVTPATTSASTAADYLGNLTPEPRFTAMVAQRTFSRVTDVWNARLAQVMSLKKTNDIDGRATAAKVSALELLQQAQGRLVLPPVRFPPRDSHLHSIFQPSGGGTTTTASSPSAALSPNISRSLEECYRDLLAQEVEDEEVLRTEYQSLRKHGLRDRMNRIFTQENRLKKQEQTLLAKLEGWASP